MWTIGPTGTIATLGAFPYTNLWVEGITDSLTNGDVVLMLRYEDTNSVTRCADTNVFTILKVVLEIRTSGWRTENVPPGFNTAYWYNQPGWSSQEWLRVLGFYKDPAHEEDSCGHMEGKGSVKPVFDIDTNAVQFYWRQSVTQDVWWSSPTTCTNDPEPNDDPIAIAQDRIPLLSSNATELCVFMRDDPGGPWPNFPNATNRSTLCRRRMNAETWLQVSFDGGKSTNECFERKQWYLCYAFTRATTTNSWVLDTNAPAGDNSVGIGATSTNWGL